MRLDLFVYEQNFFSPASQTKNKFHWSWLNLIVFEIVTLVFYAYKPSSLPGTVYHICVFGKGGVNKNTLIYVMITFYKMYCW